MCIDQLLKGAWVTVLERGLGGQFTVGAVYVLRVKDTGNDYQE